MTFANSIADDRDLQEHNAALKIREAQEQALFG